MVSPPPPSPVASKGKVFFWSHSPTRTLAHPSNVGKLCPHYSPTNTQNQLGILAESYEDLEECMEPMKQLSLLLEYSIEPTIHNTVGLFLKTSV